MHQKHGKFCMQDNQLLIKTLVDLKDNPILSQHYNL